MVTEKTETQSVEGDAGDDETLEVELKAEHAEELPPAQPEPSDEVRRLQETIDKQGRELGRFRTQAQDFAAITERLERVEQGIAITHELFGSGDGETPESPVQQRSRDWAARQVSPLQEDIKRFRDEAKEAGVDVNTKEAEAYFAPLGPRGALAALPAYKERLEAEQAKGKEDADTQRKTEIDAAIEAALAPVRAENAAMKAKLGLTTVETGGPTTPVSKPATPYEGALAEIKRLKGEGDEEE